MHCVAGPCGYRLGPTWLLNILWCVSAHLIFRLIACLPLGFASQARTQIYRRTSIPLFRYALGDLFRIRGIGAISRVCPHSLAGPAGCNVDYIQVIAKAKKGLNVSRHVRPRELVRRF